MHRIAVTIKYTVSILFSMTQKPLDRQGLLIITITPKTHQSLLYSRRMISPTRSILYLKTNTHKSETAVPPAGFEPAIPPSELPHFKVFDRAVTGIGMG
jgi:hypothetical protein